MPKRRLRSWNRRWEQKIRLMVNNDDQLFQMQVTGDRGVQLLPQFLGNFKTANDPGQAGGVHQTTLGRKFGGFTISVQGPRKEL